MVGSPAPCEAAKPSTAITREAGQPEAARGPLPGAQDGGHGCGRGQDADDHGAVRRGEALQRDGGEERPPEHHAEGHDGHAPELCPRRQRRAGEKQDQRGGDGGHRLAPDADERGIELLDGHTRGGQREAEGEHTEEPEQDRHGA